MANSFSLFLSLPLVASAQERSDDAKAALDRWRQMSPQEKQELRERYERWKSLSPAEKGDLQRKLETWRKLPPEEKATRSMAAGLEPELLYEGCDLDLTTDFRAVCGEVLSRHMGQSDLGKAFPGYKFPSRAPRLI